MTDRNKRIGSNHFAPSKKPKLVEQETLKIKVKMDQNNDQSEQKLIIVTGFGPFVGHTKVNPSWEAVRLLPDELEYNGTKYKLEKQKIPVEYAAVDQAVENIWKRNPEMVIHCGVHGGATCIHVETLAYNHQFNGRDYAGKTLASGTACLQNCGNETGADDVIHCRLDIEKIVAVIAEKCSCTPIKSEIKSEEIAKVSNDVGSYLCGYIYLKSLDINPSRSLFLHVPPIDKPERTAQTSEAINKIAEECIRQLVEDMKGIC